MDRSPCSTVGPTGSVAGLMEGLASWPPHLGRNAVQRPRPGTYDTGGPLLKAAARRMGSSGMWDRASAMTFSAPEKVDEAGRVSHNERQLPLLPGCPGQTDPVDGRDQWQGRWLVKRQNWRPSTMNEKWGIVE